MRPYTLAFREALAAVRESDEPVSVLLRSIMAWPGWRVAGQMCAEGLQLSVVNAGGEARIVELFSDDEALSAFESAASGPVDTTRTTLSGHALFGMLGEADVDKISFNPLSPSSMSYTRESLPLLATWANTVALELAVYEPERIGDPLGLLSRYKGWRVVLQRSGDKTALVLAPDASGRDLAALFSAQDSAESFVEELGSSGVSAGELEVVQRDARSLFADLSQLDLDGLVINPMSNLPPRALSARILPRLVEMSS